MQEKEERFGSVRDGGGRDQRDLDDLDGKMMANEIRETWTARHDGVLALLVLDVGDDDGLCAVSSELASRDLAHAVYASGDNGHLALELIV